MHSTTLLPMGIALLSVIKASAAYTLVQTYDATNFFDEFTFFTAADPTEGYVEYVSETTADAADLVYNTNNQVYLGVDYTTNNPANGRESVRLSSNTAYSSSNHTRT
jgi:hypothetical protein